MVSVDFSCRREGCSNHWPTEYSGCPECAAHYCQECASHYFDMICDCGGELQQDQYFQAYDFTKLPKEILQYKTLKERIRTLNEIRPQYGFIEAEYNQYKSIIVYCERKARINRTEVQDNIGYYKIADVPEGCLHYIEATRFLFDYAIPSNVEQLLSLVSDDYFMKDILENLDSAPRTEDEWEETRRSWKVISTWVKGAIIIPEDCGERSFHSYRESVELIRKYLNRE
ncbi:hypothetical protein [Gimesia panareensis]|uniref:hypothetical protein n=1 Tax=Gimesia panareensis TaxID=2527978 RepID=UPI0011883502|nr:hypothetical protein [Gimesia panareensis]QDU52166.1 hypothetical protein Pan110_45380 [Gimesia panareensis]